MKHFLTSAGFPNKPLQESFIELVGIQTKDTKVGFINTAAVIEREIWLKYRISI